MAKRVQTIKSLSSYPFHCPNCDKLIKEIKIYCSDLCRDEASFIRYYRACIADKRIKQNDVKAAIAIRLAHILAGGYNARSRRIPDSIRKEVIRRDNGRCRVCGKPGNQIDHIRGNSSDINNLQLLCLNCHNKKTMANLKPISPDSHPEKYAHAEALLSRVHTSKPLRLCDGTDWSKNWRKILKARKEMGKKMINIRNKNASLFMRKNRHYWHFYYWGRDEKRHCISTGESLKDKAEQFMKQFLTDLEKR